MYDFLFDFPKIIICGEFDFNFVMLTLLKLLNATCLIIPKLPFPAMRFKFCGDLDCPDWVLAEMAVMSKLSVVKFKLLCDMIGKKIITDSRTVEHERVVKMFPGAEELDLKAVLAALNFIYTQAAKYDAEASVLENELQQLGLPAEHARQLTKSYSALEQSLRTALKGRGLRRSRLVNCEWRVLREVTGDPWPPQQAEGPMIELVLTVEDPNKGGAQKRVPMVMSAVQFRSLYSEVRRVSSNMRRLLAVDE